MKIGEIWYVPGTLYYARILEIKKKIITYQIAKTKDYPSGGIFSIRKKIFEKSFIRKPNKLLLLP